MKEEDRKRALEIVRKVMGPKPLGRNAMDWILTEITTELEAVRAEVENECKELEVVARRMTKAATPFTGGCGFPIGNISCPMGTATVEELDELREAKNDLMTLIEKKEDED